MILMMIHDEKENRVEVFPGLSKKSRAERIRRDTRSRMRYRSSFVLAEETNSILL